MSTIRFALLSIGLFALAFVGVSWLNKGAPVVVAGVAPLKPDSRLPTFSRVPSPLWGNEHIEVSEEVQKRMREDWERSKTSQGDGNGERDKLRRELLQAANAYVTRPSRAIWWRRMPITPGPSRRFSIASRALAIARRSRMTGLTALGRRSTRRLTSVSTKRCKWHSTGAASRATTSRRRSGRMSMSGSGPPMVNPRPRALPPASDG